MLTMLVVDDELYALQGITRGIDWSDLPFSEILEAESAEEAMRIMAERPVDLVISDIEMPGGNGLDLLRWIHERGIAAVTVFLTGHARFEYAQEALQHGCFDYVLKPVDHEALKDVVRRAVREIEERRRRRSFEEMLETYRRQWEEQLPVLVDRFWQELLTGRVADSPERLNLRLRQLGLPLQADSPVLPVLLSVEQWDIELDARDESIMEYALRKAASETILGDRPGTVLQDVAELSLVLLYDPDRTEQGRRRLLEDCRRFVSACAAYFHCRLSCYVGEAAALGGLAEEVSRLQQLESANMVSRQTVIDAAEHGAAEEDPSGGGAALPLMPFMEWGVLLDIGEYEELSARIGAALDALAGSQAGRGGMETFRHGFLHMLYQFAARRGWPAEEITALPGMGDVLGARTLPQLRQAVLRSLEAAAEAARDRQRECSAVVAKVQSFIRERLHGELSRDEIAAAVYRNPAYVSRLFRKETGMSLTEYIARARIEEAKRLLVETNDKISHIAESVGYVHLSYFAKLFRKVTGLTPQEFRKKHRPVD
ncbi:MAG TPA: helix-turn-helix domain-containing protein [Paenibacillaceae bacterium]